MTKGDIIFVNTSCFVRLSMTVMAGDAANLLRATLLIYSGRRCLFTQGDAAYLLRATLLIYSGRRLPPPKSQEAKTISISTTKLDLEKDLIRCHGEPEPVPSLARETMALI